MERGAFCSRAGGSAVAERCVQAGPQGSHQASGRAARLGRPLRVGGGWFMLPPSLPPSPLRAEPGQHGRGTLGLQLHTGVL